MSAFSSVRHLPVVFRSLDVEGKTKPVPTLVCPVRADVMTVGSCGRCSDFRRIEFTGDSLPVLCCTIHPDHAHAARYERVQEVLRVPVVCTAADTTLAVVLPYLALGTALDAIPVLDSEARPIGLVTIREARRLAEAGIPLETLLSEVMSTQFVCVLPETSLSYASQLMVQTEAQRLVVVAADGAFLGLVTQHDMTSR
jgi:CBS domain-containing protein